MLRAWPINGHTLSAWYTSAGFENADLCAWNFGATYAAPNGALANVKMRGHDYLIQRNWLNTGAGSCAIGYQTPAGGASMLGGQHLTIGQTRTSTDGRFTLVMQADGNLVLYGVGGVALWSTSTWNTTGATTTLQPDGNLVLYSTTGVALWNSGTWNNPGASLALQNDGNLVLYSTTGTVLWHSHTGGH